jgi:hypothetical protein
MYHCTKQCYDGNNLWSVGEISQTVPVGMETYFQEGLPPELPPQTQHVYLSQFARPAFEVNPDKPVPFSQYGKPVKAADKPVSTKKK